MTGEEAIKRNEELICMMETDPVVIMTYNNQKETITGLVEFNNPEQGLACCFYSRHYSLNTCLKGKNGKLYSDNACRIGNGVLYGAYPNAKQLKEYNDNCAVEDWKIKCIHRHDGTKIYPAE